MTPAPDALAAARELRDAATDFNYWSAGVSDTGAFANKKVAAEFPRSLARIHSAIAAFQQATGAPSPEAELRRATEDARALRAALLCAKRDLIPRAIVVAELRSWQEGAISASDLAVLRFIKEANLAKAQAWDFAATHVEFGVYPHIEIDAALAQKETGGE